MSGPPSPSLLQRNVRLYPWYAALFGAYFWMPVFFLYFSRRLTLDGVLLLEAVYYAAVVVLEVPSGYFSDVIGRRATLLISTLSLIAAYALFLVGTSFAVLAAAQLCMAAGIAFHSGTDAAFHYDSLADLQREEAYAAREAMVHRNRYLAGALAAIVGGAAALIDLRLAYALSLAAALAVLPITILFVEPAVHRRAAISGRGFLRQLAACLAQLRHADLRWLFLFALLMVVLNHVPYEFYQPYLELLGGDAPVLDDVVPLTAGLHAAAAWLIASWAAARSVWLRDRIGLAGTLLLCVGLQVLIIGAMGMTLHVLVIMLAALRTVPAGVMAAPLNAAIMPRLPETQRATYLSIQSLAGRLAFSLSLAALAAAAGRGAAVDWPTLSRMGLISAAFGLGGLVLLAATRGALKRGLAKGTPGK